MKAIITQTMEKPTLSGKTLVVVTITGRKDAIADKVNEYISNRIHKANFIHVAKFIVNIYNHSNTRIDSWVYTPTYR